MRVWNRAFSRDGFHEILAADWASTGNWKLPGLRGLIFLDANQPSRSKQLSIFLSKIFNGVWLHVVAGSKIRSM